MLGLLVTFGLVWPRGVVRVFDEAVLTLNVKLLRPLDRLVRVHFVGKKGATVPVANEVERVIVHVARAASLGRLVLLLEFDRLELVVV